MQVRVQTTLVVTPENPANLDELFTTLSSQWSGQGEVVKDQQLGAVVFTNDVHVDTN